MIIRESHLKKKTKQFSARKSSHKSAFSLLASEKKNLFRTNYFCFLCSHGQGTNNIFSLELLLHKESTVLLGNLPSQNHPWSFSTCPFHPGYIPAELECWCLPRNMKGKKIYWSDIIMVLRWIFGSYCPNPSLFHWILKPSGFLKWSAGTGRLLPTLKTTG